MIPRPTLAAYVVATRRALVECGGDSDWMTVDDARQMEAAWHALARELNGRNLVVEAVKATEACPVCGLPLDPGGYCLRPECPRWADDIVRRPWAYDEADPRFGEGTVQT